MLNLAQHESTSQPQHHNSTDDDEESHALNSQTPNSHTPIPTHPQKWKFMEDWRVVGPAVLVILLLVSLSMFYHTQNQRILLQPSSKIPFQKILWIYTDNEFEGESMYELVYLYHHQHVFTIQGYEVRLINSLTAYDYISNNQTINRITYTMQHSKIDEGVNNLLKLAILRQHGGILIDSYDTVFAHSDLSWIHNMFTSLNTTSAMNNLILDKYNLSPETAEIFMYNFQNTSVKYSPIFIAARPNTTLINQAFQTLLTVISTGDHPYAKELQIFVRNRDTEVDYMTNGLEATFNLVVYKHFQQEKEFNVCSYFGVQSLKINNYLIFQQKTEVDQFKIMQKEGYRQLIKSFNHDNQVDIVFFVNQAYTKQLLRTIAFEIHTREPIPLPHNSLIARILYAPNNKEIFLDPLPPREIQLCLIVMENLSQTNLTIMRESFKDQTYRNWKMVIPAAYKLKDLSKADQHTKQDQSGNTDEKVIIMQGRSNKVHNIEQAATKHCHPKSYAVLLNFGDEFNHNKAFQEIVTAVGPRDTMGAYIGVDQNGTAFVPQAVNFHRANQGIVDPDIKKMEMILNHLRVFSIESFRYIPQFDLRDIYGRYFEDRIIFLMTLLEMVGYRISQPHMHYLAKKYSHLFSVPGRVTALPASTFLRVLQKETINKEQLRMTRTRIDAQTISESIESMIQWKIPFTKLLAFNPGNEFVSVDERKGPQLIPKVIHQVWLGGALPPAKEYFYQKTKKLYPDYEVKLWRNQNITRERFPLTYDVMQTIIEFNKRSPYNKLATVTDILRHQLLYQDGGFWKDAGMNLLRPIFDKFLTFKLAITVDKTFRYRWLQGMCFFANMPKFENMWRITNFRNTNRMRIYHVYPMVIAGPIDFRNLVIGQEQYDPDFLLMPYEYTYPGQWTQHPQKDRCLRNKDTIGNLTYQIEQKGCYLISGCEEIYPYSFAIEHNCYGNSWPNRKVTLVQKSRIPPKRSGPLVNVVPPAAVPSSNVSDRAVPPPAVSKS